MRILSVSLLISFCGAGLISPDVYHVALLKEVESSHCRLSSSNSLSKLFACQPEDSSNGTSRRGWRGLKSVLTSLSSRLASLCFGAKPCGNVSQESGKAFVNDEGSAAGQAYFADGVEFAEAICSGSVLSVTCQEKRHHVEFIAASCPVRAGPLC